LSKLLNLIVGLYRPELNSQSPGRPDFGFAPDLRRSRPPAVPDQ
jgi:hypothetical protein